MATIKTVVDILETTANAMVGLEHFTYGARSDVNVDRDKGYPRLLVDRSVNIQTWDMLKNHSTVNFLFQFYGLFHRETEAQHTYQDPQQNLELIAYQYFREINQRFKDTNKIRLVETTVTDGDYSFLAGNDRLVRLQLNVKVFFIGDCSEGLFNY